jgi:hypothetical protein
MKQRPGLACRYGPCRRSRMSKILRGLAAGYGAKKLGGGGCGCGTILIFIILWIVLGHFGIFK